MESQHVDAMGPEGLGLRVSFVRRGDRYGHVISILDRSGRQSPALESVEGTPADDWPASPPLSNLSIEEVAPGRRVALLVGMAGRSHWSASIEPVPGQAAVIFDIACRTAGGGREPVQLGSRYLLLRGQVALVSDTARVSEYEAAVSIQPTAAALGSATVRWRYRAELRDEDLSRA